MLPAGPPPNPGVSGVDDKRARFHKMISNIFSGHGFHATVQESSSELSNLFRQASHKEISLDSFKRELMTIMAAKGEEAEKKPSEQPEPEKTEGGEMETTPPNDNEAANDEDDESISDESTLTANSVEDEIMWGDTCEPESSPQSDKLVETDSSLQC